MRAECGRAPSCGGIKSHCMLPKALTVECHFLRLFSSSRSTLSSNSGQPAVMDNKKFGQNRVPAPFGLKIIRHPAYYANNSIGRNFKCLTPNVFNDMCVVILSVGIGCCTRWVHIHTAENDKASPILSSLSLYVALLKLQPNLPVLIK